MKSIYDYIKTIALVWLPKNILQYIKIRHYYKTIEKFSLNEEPDLLIVKCLLHNGDYTVDIGANIGIYTKMLSEWTGERGKVFAIEPVPTTFDILQSNITKSGLTNVNLFNIAVSDRSAKVTMQIPEYTSGGDNIYQSHIIDNSGNQTDEKGNYVEVRAEILDNVLSNEIDKISFVKCDVEGHELECIKGATNLLEKSKPAWLIEISNDPDNEQSTSYELFRLLKNYGYSAWYLKNNKLCRRKINDKIRLIMTFIILPTSSKVNTNILILLLKL